MQNAHFEIEITRAQFRAAVIFSAAGDIRNYLNSVCLHVGECGDARLLGCDGHRLAIVNIEGESKTAAPGEYLLPRDAIKAIKKAAARDYVKSLILAIDGDNFTIREPYESGAIIGGGKFLEGKYPDWQRVLPRAITGEAGNYNPYYLADIAAACKELGSKSGFYEFYQNGDNSALALYDGLAVVVMPMRGADSKTAALPEWCTPRVMPRAIVETATGGRAFPCDPLQDVEDKRASVAATPAAVDPEYLAYLASIEAAPMAAAA